MESTTRYTFPVQTGGIFYFPGHRHQVDMHWKRRRGRHKSNMIPPTGNIAKWMGEHVEEIMRDSRDRAIYVEHWGEVLHGRLIVIPDGTAEEEEA